MLEYELDIIQRLLDNGSTVLYFTCFANKNFCSALPNNIPNKSISSKIKCMTCKSKVSNGLNWLIYQKGDFNVRSIDEVTITQQNTIDTLVSSLDSQISALPELEIINQVNSILPNLHQSALSALIDTTRNPNIKILENKVNYLANLRTCLQHHYSYLNAVSIYKPDVSYVFNGRGIYAPFVELSKKLGIFYTIYEYPVYGFSKYWLLLNTNVGDVPAISNYLYSFYLDNVKLIDNNFDLACEFLEGRRNYNFNSCEDVVYNRAFKKLFRMSLPSSIDNSKPIIVYFSSSSSEFATFENFKNSKITTQNQIISFISSSFPLANIIVRAHPNSSSEDSKLLEQGLLLEASNITYCSPSDNISSYFLADSAACVITYGSSMGYEAAYKGALVITIGYSMYGAFNLDYVATSLNSLYQAVDNAIYGDQSLFPSKDDRIKNAITYASTYISFGTEPLYLKRKSYFGGHMYRGKERKYIRPSVFFAFLDKLLGFIERAYNKFIVFLNVLQPL